MKFSAPKGTKDILPEESYIWQYAEDKAREILARSNYSEIRTPIFESTELFTRGVGGSTDIVNKEMYTFIQKERSLTLRPENTAGVARAYIEHGMHKLPAPLKLWYKGPMFRYERPQAGRQRQFHQLGIEVFGVKEPSADAEVIEIAMWYLNELNIPNLSLEINNIGCPDCRQEHRENIKNAVRAKLPEFCADCQVRFEKNPLRMLDCKNENCRDMFSSSMIDEIINADYQCDDCSEHFTILKDYLDKLNISYKINKKLVRGLDYYNRTVFEITSTSLGAQNAVCGCGRYDPLVEMIGGAATPAVGWAIGLERLISLMPNPEKSSIPVFIVSSLPDEALNLVFELRKSGIASDFDLAGRKFAKQLEKASKINAKYSIILAEDEISSKTLTLKNMQTGEQEKLPREIAIKKLKNI